MNLFWSNIGISQTPFYIERMENAIFIFIREENMSNKTFNYFKGQFSQILDDNTPFVPKYSSEQLTEMMGKLQEALSTYKIPCQVRQAQCGTMITQFELIPEGNTSAASIELRMRDLLRSIGVTAKGVNVRDGAECLYLEIPNGNVQKISMREVLGSKDYAPSDDDLTVAIGKKISGDIITVSIEEAPHMLIAGASGSGKSVCLNAIVSNLLLTQSPDSLRLLIIDPKGNEFNSYNNVPHLLHPIINSVPTIVQDSLATLRGACKELDRRMELFKLANAKKIQIYNKFQKKQLPYIVIVIDEYGFLADNAKALGKKTREEMDGLVTKLAQLGRAFGFHLILSMQHPSAGVNGNLNPQIKANVPKKICFKVASASCSELIIDQKGGEVLQGKGDFLTLDEVNNEGIIRGQGMFVSDEEIWKITNLWKAQLPYYARVDIDGCWDVENKLTVENTSAQSEILDFSTDVEPESIETAPSVVKVGNAAPAASSAKAEEAPKEVKKTKEKVTKPAVVETPVNVQPSANTNIPNPVSFTPNPAGAKKVVTRVRKTNSEPAKPAPSTESRNTFVETDVYGNSVEYKIVEIGNQIWMAENYKADSDFSYAPNNDEKNIPIYGRLYSWDAAVQNAPYGWHLPTRAEWQELIDFVGKQKKHKVGTALKATKGWPVDRNAAKGVDLFGFAGLPAGKCDIDGSFVDFNVRGDFWCADDLNNDKAFHRVLRANNDGFSELSDDKDCAFSVRYVKDKD